MRPTRNYRGQQLMQGLAHRGSLFQIERVHGAHQNFERIARECFVTLIGQSQTDASPVRFRWWSQRVDATLYPEREGWSVRQCVEVIFEALRHRENRALGSLAAGPTKSHQTYMNLTDAFFKQTVCSIFKQCCEKVTRERCRRRVCNRVQVRAREKTSLRNELLKFCRLMPPSAALRRFRTRARVPLSTFSSVNSSSSLGPCRLVRVERTA
jgi:hypothetical protein